MPDEPKPIDRAVFVFLDGLALALLFAGVDWLVSGKSWLVPVVCFAVAFILALAAHNWAVLKPKFGKGFAGLASRIERIATDYRYRTGSLFFAAFVIGVILLTQIRSLRQDFDMYVSPRVVTKEQASELQKALSATPSDAVVKVVANVADSEAMEYGGQLLNAIKLAGWNAQFQPVNPWDDQNRPYETRAFNRIIVVLDQGLIMRTCIVGQPVNPDPKHPTPDELLSAAFRKAKIDINGSGSAMNCDQYSLYLEIGRRPRIIGEQMPVLVRLSDWIRSLSR